MLQSIFSTQLLQIFEVMESWTFNLVNLNGTFLSDILCDLVTKFKIYYIVCKFSKVIISEEVYEIEFWIFLGFKQFQDHISVKECKVIIKLKKFVYVINYYLHYELSFQIVRKKNSFISRKRAA